MRKRHLARKNEGRITWEKKEVLKEGKMRAIISKKWMRIGRNGKASERSSLQSSLQEKRERINNISKVDEDNVQETCL